MARSAAVLLRPAAGPRGRGRPRGSCDGDLRLGVIRVEARIGDMSFETSLFPKDGGYLLPLKAAVRKPTDLAVGDEVVVRMAIRPRR